MLRVGAQSGDAWKLVNWSPFFASKSIFAFLCRHHSNQGSSVAKRHLATINKIHGSVILFCLRPCGIIDSSEKQWQKRSGLLRKCFFISKQFEPTYPEFINAKIRIWATGCTARAVGQTDPQAVNNNYRNIRNQIISSVLLWNRRHEMGPQRATVKSREPQRKLSLWLSRV